MSTRTMERHRRSGGAITYPMHHVLGIIPNPDDFPAIKAQLMAAGFTEDAICLLSGQESCASFDPEGGGHGALVRLLRAWQHFTPEYEHLARYEQAVEEGQAVVAVRAYHHLDWEAIEQILTAYSGHFIHFYGWTIHDLVP